MKANLFGLTLVVILTIQTCQSLETETSEERRAKCKYRLHRQWCFAYFFYNLFILLSVLPIFQVIRFPVSIFLNTYVCTTKKSRKFLIFLSFFRMMAAQVPIEMVLAIQGKCLYKNDRFKNVMYLIFYVLYCVFFSEECSSKGGTSDGSCASGFGVCCVCMHQNTLYYWKPKYLKANSSAFLSGILARILKCF